MGGAPDFSESEWEDEKDNVGLDFPSLPYFLDGPTRLTDNLAIHKYIARKWGQPQLLGKTDLDRANVAMVASLLMECYNKLQKGCYDV